MEGVLTEINVKLELLLAATSQDRVPASSSTTAAPPAPFDMNLLLHQGRGARLRLLPRGAKVFVSAGCSGTWFFDWIEQCYGSIPRHIGVEYYSPKPSDLPPNVEWIENTCSDMSSVETGIADLVFSGQNLEHLWPEEVTGFLLEAARITKQGGLLVVDSPNRLVTEALRTWIHPEHTVELTPDEAAELLALAGFDVARTYGIWLGRDLTTGQVLPHTWSEGQPLSIAERLLTGTDSPDHSFIWWIEARRTARPPEPDQLKRRMDEIFALAWPERVQRNIGAGSEVELRSDGEWLIRPEGPAGVVNFGPYVPLPAGRYRCSFHVCNRTAQAARLQCDVFLGRLDAPLKETVVDVAPGDSTIEMCFELQSLEFGVQFRCISLDGRAIECRRTVDLFHLAPTGRDLSVVMARAAEADASGSRNLE